MYVCRGLMISLGFITLEKHRERDRVNRRERERVGIVREIEREGGGNYKICICFSYLGVCMRVFTTTCMRVYTFRGSIHSIIERLNTLFITLATVYAVIT